MINKTVKIQIGGNSYDVGFPKTGQLIDIQIIKAKITEDRLEAFKNFGIDGILCHIIVDTIATFNIMIPQLKEDLVVNGLLDLSLDKMIEIAYIYKDVYKPFYDGILDEITA